MRRKFLILVTGGAIATALVGTALGAGAAELAPPRDGTAPAAVGAPDPDASRTVTPGDAPFLPGTPTGEPSLATPPGGPATGPDGAPAAGTGTGPGTVGRQRAVEIALARTGGGELIKVETEQEHGRTVWSVRIGRDGERLRIDVDARTGQVVRAERASGDDGAGDDRSGDDDRGGDRHGRGSND